MSTFSSIDSDANNAPDNICKSKDDLSAYSMSAENGQQLSVVDKPEILESVIDCPRDIKRGTFLRPLYYILNNGLVFTDKLLPDPTQPLVSDSIKFQTDYFTNLHFQVSSHSTYNHLGARIPLAHSSII